MYHSFLIYLSADGYLGRFHVLAIINSAVMIIGVPVSFSIFLKILKLFMHKLKCVCVCVCVCVCEYISSTYQACLEPQLQVWVQAAGAGGPPCTFCTEVGDWVPSLGSCDVQWKLFDTLIEGNCESSFLFTTTHIVIRSAGPLPGCCWCHGK